jgi:hypothetical protein
MSFAPPPTPPVTTGLDTPLGRRQYLKDLLDYVEALQADNDALRDRCSVLESERAGVLPRDTRTRIAEVVMGLVRRYTYHLLRAFSLSLHSQSPIVIRSSLGNPGSYLFAHADLRHPVLSPHTPSRRYGKRPPVVVRLRSASLLLGRLRPHRGGSRGALRTSSPATTSATRRLVLAASPPNRLTKIHPPRHLVQAASSHHRHRKSRSPTSRPRST